jgi:glycosyltransferase involved in cell wall biosynthesis
VILNVGEDCRTDIDGWSVDILPFYAQMAEQLPDGAKVVEIGVYHGRSLLYLAERLWALGKRNCQLYAVDTWGRVMTPNPNESWNSKDEEIFRGNCIKIGEAGSLVYPLWLTSNEAAVWFSGKRGFETFNPTEFDLIFIDGAHDYESVKADIVAWKSLVKVGGILSGHDYWNWGEHEGVGRAVDEAFPGVATCGSVWWTLFSGIETSGEVRDFCSHAIRETRGERVTVVIPCMNQAEYLIDAVASVVMQTYGNIELILVCGDEVSRATALMLQTGVSSPYPESPFAARPISILSGYNKGRGHALNAAIQLANGKYIFRLDADDRLAPDAIEKLVAATPPNEAFTITTCNAQRFGASQEPLITAPFFAYNELQNNFILSGSLFTRMLWAMNGGFPQSLCDYEDWSFWIASLPFLPVVTKVNEKLFLYRIHDEQATVFASKHDPALRAMVHMLNPEIYAKKESDEATLRSAAEPLKAKVRKFSAWFPDDLNAQRFGQLVGETPKPSTVCLVMICKNEEKTIARALESVKGHIDSWVIVDTGSTDRTEEVVLRTLIPIPGSLIKRPWVNFGYNRTEALQFARDAVGSHCDYLLILDADDTLEAEPGAFKALTAPAYEIKLQHGGGTTTYWKTHLIRVDGDWRYEGATHEVIVSPSGLTAQRLPGPIYHCNNDGARAADPKMKFLRDAELLEEQHARIPEDNRTLFYLAQSYRDAGETEKAIAAYRKRVAAGGWAEEVYLSLYNVALLYEGIGMGAFVITAYLAAWQYRPSRAEPLYRLAAYHRGRKEWDLAYLFASQAVKILPSSDSLFVDESVVLWRCQDELAVAASWTGRHWEAVDIWTDLLSSGNFPKSEHGRAREYLQARAEKDGQYVQGLKQGKKR